MVTTNLGPLTSGVNEICYYRTFTGIWTVDNERNIYRHLDFLESFFSNTLLHLITSHTNTVDLYRVMLFGYVRIGSEDSTWEWNTDELTTECVQELSLITILLCYIAH